MLKTTKAKLLACTAIILCLPTQLAAQDVKGTANTVLEKVVVTGQAEKVGDVADTPLAAQTVEAEQIRTKEINSIQDLGRTLEPGVDYIKSEGGIFIRGLGGPRVATLIDGVPIPFLSNDARSGSGGPTTVTNAQGGGDSFSFSSLSSLDVVRGADSSRIGTGALGGALVLRTLEPDDLIRDGKDWGSIAKLTYDSADNSFDGSVAVAKRIQQYSLLFSGGYKAGDERQTYGSDDSLGATRTEANPAESDQNNLLFKFQRDFDGGHALGLTLERFDREIKTDLRTLQGATTNSSRVYQVGNYNGHDDTLRERVSLNYDYDATAPGGLVEAATLTPYWQRITKNAGSEGVRVGTVAGPWYRDNELEETDIGTTGAISTRLTTGTLDHEITFGGDGAYLQSRSFLTGIDACSLGTASPSAIANSCPALHANQSDMPDVDGKRLGLYVDDAVAINDSGLTLTPGLRFDWYDYDPKESANYSNNSGFGAFGLPEGSDGSRLSPKLLGSYQVSPDIDVFAQWSMAYRAPTMSELYLNFSNPAQGYAVTGNPDLKPETANGFALGASFDRDDLQAGFTVFYNKYKNFIDTNSVNTADFPFGLTTNINRANVRIVGVEINASKSFDSGINLHGGVAYAYGKDTGAGEYLRSVAPVKTIVGTGYEQQSWGTDLSLIASAGVRDDPNANTINAPGYGIVDFTAWWEPGQMDGLRIQAGVYNLLDKEYYNGIALRDVSTTAPAANNSNQLMEYYSEPGRTFKVSLTKQF